MINNRKGIILAGGTGSRLYPLTLATTKQLMPVYDKPMIFYPISVMMLSGIRDIAIITTKQYLENFKRLLGDGSKFGVQFVYFIQEEPNGIAESFIIAENFIKGFPVCLILGDNIFYGQGLEKKVAPAVNRTKGATIFGYQVSNPSRFGVVEFNKLGKVISLEEKPKFPKSNFAVTGLYFYDENVLNIAKTIKPSNRGELEISDINAIYLRNQDLKVEVLGRGFSWLDSGTHDSLLESSNFVKTIQNNTGNFVACLEEIAFRNKWITQKDIEVAAEKYKKNSYGKYLKSLLV